jgi:hypothetical protein
LQFFSTLLKYEARIAENFSPMKKSLVLLFTLLFAASANHAHAQAAAAREFEIKKVAVELIQTPQFSVTGPPQKAHKPAQWVEIEVEFDAKPEFSDELVFNYYVFLNKRLFVGQVSHVNVEKGMALHSVMYMSPKMVARIMAGKTLTAGEVIATVQITKPGVQMAVAEKSSKAGTTPNWWAAMKQETGFLSNKNETPFAPLYWDRYEAIKPAAR